MLANLLKADISELARHFEQLATMNDTPEVDAGMTRPVYGRAWQRAEVYLADEMEKLGLAVHRDAVGNLYGELSGSQAELAPVWTGSHIDSVPHGGCYDGVAGILAGLEAARLLRASGKIYPRTLSVNVYAGEEMSRFGVCCIGSRALAGKLTEEDLKNSKDSETGDTLRGAMEAAGIETKQYAVDFAKRPKVYASLELHIEQGKRLEQAGVPIGIVTGICAPTNFYVNVCGTQGHAGGVPMDCRRDACMAACEMVLELERLARTARGEYLTATVGRIETFPGTPSVIPGQVRFSVDIRAIKESDKARFADAFRRAAEEIAVRRGVHVDFSEPSDDLPVHCDDDLQHLLAEKSKDLGYPSMPLISGPYHDSLFLHAFSPVAMLFVPSKGGISHDKHEHTNIEDIAKGTDVLASSLDALLSRTGVMER